MSFASDKLYNGYLRRNMPTIVTKVKVREIIIHLPCLTAHDRENIEAKRETYGNYDGMVLLLDCLKRRENWPEQFIEALEACEHLALAAAIRAEYDALRGVNNSNPSSPSTTVVRAHVHPTPSAGHLPVPETVGDTEAAAPSAEPSAPLQPAAQASPPEQTRPHPAAHEPEAAPPPEPVPEPPQSNQIEVAPSPSTPPPSPDTTHAAADTPPPTPPQREGNAHREPEENSESDIQDLSVDGGVTPGETNEVAVDSVAAPSLRRPVEHSEPAALSHADPVQTAAEISPPQSPLSTLTNSDVTDGSSFLTLTPEKPPVQDTAPPADKIPAVVQKPEETCKPPTTQVVESSPQKEAATPAPPPPLAAAAAAGTNASIPDVDSLCLSKPCPLISFQPQPQPQNHDSPATIPAHNPPAAPYSGDTDRLEMSEDPVSSACSAAANTASGLPCQENGVMFNHNEPEENSYDSLLSMQEVRENVVHVSEEPSILNLDGQTAAPPTQIVNGEAAREIAPSSPSSTTTTTTAAADTVSGLNPPSAESYHPSEPAPATIPPDVKTLPDTEEKKKPCRALSANTKYILTAAGVGALAVMAVLKYKH